MGLFEILIPFQKEVSSEGKLRLFGGIASSTSIDRDNERMDKSVLTKIAKGLENATVFFNHNLKGLGVGKVARTEVRDNQVYIDVLPTTAKGMEDVIIQIQEGILKSFSIGGRIIKAERIYDDSLKKDINVIQDVEVYEVSVVGVPANKDASMLSYIVKSFEVDKMQDQDEADKKEVKDEKKKDENKDKKKEEEKEKKSGILELPEIQKALSDFKSDYDSQFSTLKKEFEVREKAMKDSFEESQKAYEARINELHKKIDERAKALQTSEQALIEKEEQVDTKKAVTDETVRFIK
jgi:HK97 family phage prohead protease